VERVDASVVGTRAVLWVCLAHAAPAPP
jgi:hypothetical protein